MDVEVVLYFTGREEKKIKPEQNICGFIPALASRVA